MIERIDGLVTEQKIDGKVERLVNYVEIRKPQKGAFFRVRVGDINIHKEMGFLEDADQWGTFYIVTPQIFNGFRRDCFMANLVTAIDMQDNVFLWPLKSVKNGPGKAWSESARAVAYQAESEWLKICSASNHYYAEKLERNFKGPEWPNKNISELIQIAAKNMFINSVDHPIIKKIQGRM